MATKQILDETQAMSAGLAKILRGHEPEVQGAVLADALSIFLAGFPVQLREMVLRVHMQAVMDLLPCSEQQIFGPDGHPGNLTKEQMQ